MDFFYYEFQVPRGYSIEVEIDQAANVLLLDQVGFNSYRNGSSFRYHGGLVKHTPCILRPPYPGHWHIAIDLGGGSGMIHHSARLVRR